MRLFGDIACFFWYLSYVTVGPELTMYLPVENNTITDGGVAPRHFLKLD